MTTLPTQSFDTIVSNIASGVQGRAAKLLNFQVGSTLRAIAEGYAGVFLWFEALALQLLTAIRLSTSTGDDVDTFTADFMPILPDSQTATLPNGTPRLGAQAASGLVTFSRFTAGPASCFIPVGATMRTGDGSQNFVVTADTLFTSYSATLGGYTMPSNVGTLIVPVAAVIAGSAGNIAAAAISVITTSLTGIDAVTNVAAFTDGADRESDNALKKRFSDYILGLSRGDIYGLTAAIEGAEVNIQWTLTEGLNYDGSYHPGYFFVVADDGSGAPSQEFIDAVTKAADAVRPLSMQFAVFPPTVIEATPSMIIKTAPTFDHEVVVAQVAAAVAAGINGLGLGNSLYITMISAWAYSVPGVTAVTALLLNGEDGDSATLFATTPSYDGLTQMGTATVKAAAVIVS